ncbi:hypothetical protein JCM11491_002825 [Sporobolomyces phaffii]
MTSTPPFSSSSTAANVHQYLHLAPAYAQPPVQSTSAPALPTSTPARISSKAPHPRAATGPTSHPRPWEEHDLEGLVLEYLLSECYRDSALAFANEIRVRRHEDRPRDAHETVENEHEMEGVESTPPPESWTAAETETAEKSEAARGEDEADGAVDGVLKAEQLEDARLRRTIREAILSGRVAQATSLIHTHYPSVLAPSSPPTSSPSKLSPVHPRSPKHTSSCTPRTFFVLSEPSPPASLPSTSSPNPPLAVVGSTFGSWATSFAPEILSLNLQLQAFVELMRTGHATSALSTPSTPTSSINGLNPSAAAPGGAGFDEPGMTSSVASLASMSTTTSTSLLSTAIAASQALLSSIQALPPSKDKESWERECVDVCGLLAYKDLTNCPVRGYLEASRREGLAEMVNSAILQRTNRSPLPLLALAARSTTALWSSLGEMKIQFPPATTTTTSGQNGTTKTKVTKTYPSFDFAQFVHDSSDSTGAESMQA